MNPTTNSKIDPQAAIAFITIFGIVVAAVIIFAESAFLNDHLEQLAMGLRVLTAPKFGN